MLSLDSTTTSLCLTMFETEFEAPQNRNIRADQIIQFTGAKAQAECPGPLRRVVVWDEENEREITLLTNLFHFGATTIADIYKERWKIEARLHNPMETPAVLPVAEQLTFVLS